MRNQPKIEKVEGFSLVELLIVVGLLSVIAVGTSMQLLKSYRDHMHAGSKANLVQTAGLISKAFGKKSANNTRKCQEILVPVGPFNASGETDVEIRFSNSEVLSASAANKRIAGAANFDIKKLYLADVVSLAPERPNSYLTNLYLVGDIGTLDSQAATKPRNVATVVVKINPADNTIQECNVSTSMPSESETCNAMFGMKWNAETSLCEQDVAVDPDYKLKSCPPATEMVGGICRPRPSTCGFEQIAKGYDKAQPLDCKVPKLGGAVGIATLPVPPPQEGVPDQVPRQIASVQPTATPVTTAPIAAAPAPVVPSTCMNGTTIGVTNYDACYADPSCREQITGLGPATGCVATTPVTYSTPTPASTPSNAPPNDGSCQCDSARIANGSYCTYCNQDVNVGYVYVDYVFSVSQCVDGNLVPRTGSSLDYSECSGGYAPSRFDGVRFRQLGGYDLR